MGLSVNLNLCIYNFEVHVLYLSISMTSLHMHFQREILYHYMYSKAIVSC